MNKAPLIIAGVIATVTTGLCCIGSVIVTNMPKASTSHLNVLDTAPSSDIRSGILQVGTDVQPGTYTTTVPTGATCYWARLKGTHGGLDEIIANGVGNAGQQVIVTIDKGDVAFESRFCGDWKKTS